MKILRRLIRKFLKSRRHIHTKEVPAFDWALVVDAVAAKEEGVLFHALNAGYNPNAANARGLNALHAAASHGKGGMNMLRLLYAYGGNLDAATTNKKTVYTYFARRENIDEKDAFTYINNELKRQCSECTHVSNNPPV